MAHNLQLDEENYVAPISRRMTLREPPATNNPMYDVASEMTTSNAFYETVYAEPQMMNESVVDSPVAKFSIPPNAPKKESRGYRIGVGLALLAVAVIGVIALVMSLGKSDSDGTPAVPTATSVPLYGPVGTRVVHDTQG